MPYPLANKGSGAASPHLFTHSIRRRPFLILVIPALSNERRNEHAAAKPAKPAAHKPPRKYPSRVRDPEILSRLSFSWWVHALSMYIGPIGPTSCRSRANGRQECRPYLPSRCIPVAQSARRAVPLPVLPPVAASLLTPTSPFPVGPNSLGTLPRQRQCFMSLAGQQQVKPCCTDAIASLSRRFGRADFLDA